MASVTARETRDARGHAGECFRMIVFASVLLAIGGVFNLIDGIAAVAKSSVFVANARYVIGDLRAWGVVVLILVAVQLLAAFGVVIGNQAARWLGVAVIGLSTIAQMFFLPG